EYNPESFVDYRNIGLTLSAQKKTIEAIDAFKKSIEVSEKLNLNEKYNEAYVSLSMELGKNGKWQEAEQEILKENIPNSDLSSFYNEWGNDLYNASKDYTTAEAKFRKAIEYNPESFVDYRNIGLTLSAQKKTIEAIDAFKKSIEVSEKLNLNEKYNE